jgi:hypothetical protein
MWVWRNGLRAGFLEHSVENNPECFIGTSGRNPLEVRILLPTPTETQRE